MKWKFVVFACWVWLQFCVPSPAGILPTNAVVGGKTIGEWTAEWWKWAYATPTNQNPPLDSDGSRAHNGQPGGAVFFIATPSGLNPGSVTRTFSVPTNKYLLVNLLPVNAENIDTDPPLTVSELRDQLATIIANPRELHATIDGVAVTNLLEHLAISPVFSLFLADEDNLKSLQYGHTITGLIDPEVSDGYWLMIEPLAPGPHVLNFGGTWNEAFTYFPVATTAHITVMPDYVLPTNGVVAGKTIGEWSAEWYKWIFSISTNRHPLFDLDGSRAHNGQPGGEVFFLVGMNGVPQTTQSVTRTFHVTEGKHLFFPVINFGADNVFTAPPLTVQELRDLNAGFVQKVTALHASIDSMPVPADLFSHRAISPVFSFDFTNADNIESYWAGQPFTGLNDPIVADGFWLMIKPLPLGEHEVRFGGATGPPWEFGLDVTAKITVVPDYVMPTNAVVDGKTIGEWTAEWWKWIWLQPTNNHPLFDPDGRWASNGQSEGPVFFLTGVSADIQGSGKRTRVFSIPEGKYLFLGLNTEWENIDADPPLAVQELRDFAAATIATITELHATIDDVSGPDFFQHRHISPVYSYMLPDANNLKTAQYGHPITGLIDPAVSDGYWIMVEPLPVGTHVINWGGTFGPEPLSFNMDITDIITVAPNYVLPTNAVIGGKTIGEWTAEWWKWGFSISTNQHPFFDTNGSLAHVGQPGGDVFFIAGQVGIPLCNTCTFNRTFAVPEGKYLLLPLIHFWADNVFSDILTVPELRDLVAGFVGSVTALHASIDGAPVPTDLFAHRAISSVFSVTFTNADNFESYMAGQPFTGLDDPMVADGYWLMLNPLPPGSHVVNFGAMVGGTWNLNIDITANINVVPFPSFASVAPTSNGHVRLAFNGFYGQTYVLQTSTNLVNWVPVSTNTVTTGPLEFLDTEAASFKHRFYRAVQMQ